MASMILVGTLVMNGAASKDSQGMPVIYLRGECTSNWAANENYKFTRNGNTYSLIITSNNPVSGQFKLADDDWETFDFGGTEDNISINETQNITLIRTGKNLQTQGISSGVISFEYPGNNNFCEVKFDLGSTKLPDPWSGTLPVMHINVYKDEKHTVLDNEIIDYNLNHKDYFKEAVYWLDVNGCEWMEESGAKSVGSEEEPLPLQIKARGNWTRIGFSKKPFKLKLDKKQNLLGLTPDKSKHYALLAHADDTKGYLRNFTSFNLGERIGLPWTPGVQPVELVINGDYRGLYFLTESIRVGDGRIEIEELDDNSSDPETVSGGYVVELDNYDEENQIRMTEKTCVNYPRLDVLRITWDTPEVYSELQKKFVTEQFEAMNNAIGSNSDKTWSYLDLDDAARYYIVNEVISHTESYHGSTYLFRDRGEGQKWHFSPLWDAGNAFNGSTDNFFYDPYVTSFGNTWIPSLRANKRFNDKVRETWLWFMQNEYEGLENDMEEFIDHLKSAAQSDYKRWHNEPVPSGGQQVADNRDLGSKFNEVRNHLRSKINWLKNIFGDYTAGIFDEPERDDTEAAPLPEYATSGVENIITGDSDAPAEYFNLQGIRVNNPKPGEIYIIRQGGRSFKAIFR